MTSFNVFKAVKLGEATNYRLTLKRVRRKARRRLTAIQQWYRPENWKHVIPWCCLIEKAKQLCESQSHGIDVTHPRLTSRLTQQPSSAVDAKSVTLTPPQHTTHSPFRSHSSPASALRSPRFRFLRHHRRDGRALPLLRRGGVLPRHPLGGVPGRGAPPDPRDARRAPGALLNGGPEEATGKQQPAGGCSSRGWGTGEREAEPRRQQLLPAAQANAFARASR